MGHTKWHPHEEEFLRMEFSSAQAREIFKKGAKGALHQVASLIATKYQAQFGHPFAEETPAELHLCGTRIKTRKHHNKLQPFPQELQEDCQTQLTGVSDVSTPYVRLMPCQPVL